MKLSLKERKQIIAQISKTNPLRFGAGSFYVPIADSEKHIELLMNEPQGFDEKIRTFDEAQYYKYASRWEVTGPIYRHGIGTFNDITYEILEPKIGVSRAGVPAFVKGEYQPGKGDRAKSCVHPLTDKDFPAGREFLLEMLKKAIPSMYAKFDKAVLPDLMTTLQSSWKASGAMSGYFSNAELILMVDRLKDVNFDKIRTLREFSNAIPRDGMHKCNQKSMPTLFLQIIYSLGLTRDEWLRGTLNVITKIKPQNGTPAMPEFLFNIIYKRFGDELTAQWDQLQEGIQNG